MNAEQFITLADALRASALRQGRNLNDSNLFVHSVLMHALGRSGGVSEDAILCATTACLTPLPLSRDSSVARY